MSALYRYDSPVTVGVSVTYVTIGDLDILRHRFEAELLIKAKWREPRLDKERQASSSHVEWRKQWSPKLYILNSKALTEESTTFSLQRDDSGQATVVKDWRVQGLFQESWDFAHFPFDVQELAVVIASRRSNVEVKLTDDSQELHHVARYAMPQHREWTVYRYVSSEVGLVTGAESCCPSMVVKGRIARKSSIFFWNHFFIILLVSTLTLATFSVTKHLPYGRLQLSFSLLLSSLVLRMMCQANLPKIPQLTLMDKYVLYSIVLQSSVCAWHSMVPGLVHPGLVDRLVFLAFCIFTGLFNIAFVLHIKLKVLSCREEVAMMEEVYLAQLQGSSHRIPLYRRMTDTMLDIGKYITGNQHFKGF